MARNYSLNQRLGTAINQAQADLYRATGQAYPTAIVPNREVNAESHQSGRITVNSGVPAGAATGVYYHEATHSQLGHAARGGGPLIARRQEGVADFGAGVKMARTGHVGDGSVRQYLRTITEGPSDFVHGGDARRIAATMAGVRYGLWLNRR